MKNNASKYQICHCPHCEMELKRGCLMPGFCRPCYINGSNKKNSGVKTCAVCKCEYSDEYDECPACAASRK